jgi:hypothetical protein
LKYLPVVYAIYRDFKLAMAAFLTYCALMCLFGMLLLCSAQ